MICIIYNDAGTPLLQMNTHVLSQFIYYTNEKFDNANLYTLVPEKMDSPRVPKCHFKRIEGLAGAYHQM